MATSQKLALNSLQTLKLVLNSLQSLKLPMVQLTYTIWLFSGTVIAWHAQGLSFFYVVREGAATGTGFLPV